MGSNGGKVMDGKKPSIIVTERLPSLATQRRKLRRYRPGEVRAAIYLLIPSFIGFVAFLLFPAVRGLYMSLTDWDLMTDPNFIGLENYRRLIADTYFWNSLQVTVRYVVYNVPLQTLISLSIALLMNHLKRSTALRMIVLLPYFIPNVVIGLLFLVLLHPVIGPVNLLLESIGLSRIQFLRLPGTALPSIVGINIWRHMGYIALLFFAGLQMIPNDLYEAARIDGASAPQSFFKITLPLLRPVVTFVVITAVIGSFQIFDTVAVTTEGGPLRTTEVLIWFIFQHAFQRFDMGYGATATMVLFVILIVFTLLYMKISRGGKSDLA